MEHGRHVHASWGPAARNGDGPSPALKKGSPAPHRTAPHRTGLGRTEPGLTGPDRPGPAARPRESGARVGQAFLAPHSAIGTARRGVAQSGSAAVLGTAGRRFESYRPDQSHHTADPITHPVPSDGRSHRPASAFARSLPSPGQSPNPTSPIVRNNPLARPIPSPGQFHCPAGRIARPASGFPPPPQIGGQAGGGDTAPAARERPGVCLRPGAPVYRSLRDVPLDFAAPSSEGAGRGGGQGMSPREAMRDDPGGHAVAVGRGTSRRSEAGPGCPSLGARGPSRPNPDRLLEGGHVALKESTCPDRGRLMRAGRACSSPLRHAMDGPVLHAKRSFGARRPCNTPG